MNKIYDNHGRQLNYVRLAVTDRCNLRCFYCMPEDGIRYLHKKELLTYEEIERLITLLASMGISKVRLTGGEPFVRNDMMKLVRTLAHISGIDQLHLTTNGVLTKPFIPELKEIGVQSVNLSLDSLDKKRFYNITHRDEFDRVMDTYHGLLHAGIGVKINTVVMEDKNIEDIIPLVELTKEHKVSVRFIEEMPFNGEGNHYPKLHWTFTRIINYIKEHYPSLTKIADPQFSTSYNYHIPGYEGSVGVIAAFSRTFCGTCNRLRITAQGELKTCLYDGGGLNIKSLLRSTSDDGLVAETLMQSFKAKPKDGFEAEKQRMTNNPISESMSTIGG